MLSWTSAGAFVQQRVEENVKAHTQQGMTAADANKLKEAERHFAAAASLAPSDPSTRNNYGAILMRTGRSNLAAVEFEQSLNLDPNQHNALVNLAQIRFAADDLRASGELFRRALMIKPEADVARALLIIALRLKDRSAVLTYYPIYVSVLAAENRTQTAAEHAELGDALFEAGLLDQAHGELGEVFRLNPKDADSLVRLARIYLARNEITAARRTLEAAVERGNEAAPVYALLADVYEQSGHLEKAIPAMRLAIQRDPQSEKYRFAYAVLLTNSNAPGAAVIRLEESLQTFPASSRLWFALGFANFRLDKNEEAERALRKAIDLDPKFAPAFAYLGLIRAKTGAYDEAIKLYGNALDADSKLAVVHHLIADAMLKQNAGASSIEMHLRQAVTMDPAFTPARLSLGKLFMRAQRWSEAVVELEQVVKLDPEVSEAYYQLGLAYGRLKRTADAQSAMATFKRLSDAQKKREDTELREVVKRLSNVRF